MIIGDKSGIWKERIFGRMTRKSIGGFGEIEEIEEIEKFIFQTFQISIAFTVCRLTIRDE